MAHYETHSLVWPYGAVDSYRLGHEFSRSRNQSFPPLSSGKQAPWPSSIQFYSIVNDITGAFWQQSEQDTKETLVSVTSASPSETSQNTIVHDIVNSNLAPAENTFDHIFEELATVSSAAFETTASTLRLIIFHVFSEKRNSVEAPSRGHSRHCLVHHRRAGPAANAEAAAVPYGCHHRGSAHESRPRVSDKDLFYGDWRIPAGSPVGMTVLLMHTDKALYRSQCVSIPSDGWVRSP